MAGSPVVPTGDDASVDDAGGSGVTPGQPVDDSSSCGCKAAGAGGSWGLASLGAPLGAAFLLRRRRSRRR
jgi:hypothetical protein